MSEDPLAGLRAYIQETETRLNDLEIASRNHYAVYGQRPAGLNPDPESTLLAQIHRMAKSLATMQEQLVKVAMERDEALAKIRGWERACGFKEDKMVEVPLCIKCKSWEDTEGWTKLDPPSMLSPESILGRCAKDVWVAGKRPSGNFGCVLWEPK